jgi:flavin-dependent dehydrogenase
MAPEVYDVVIIGGGLAGSIAGFHLAKRGYSAIIIESRLEAHHKVCGEFLTSETIAYLEEMGVNLPGLGANMINEVALHSSSQRFHAFLKNPGLGLSRYLLDEACLLRAKEMGCFVRRGTHVERFRQDTHASPYLVDTSTGVVGGKRIFIATGKQDLNSLAARQGRESESLGFKMYYHLCSPAQDHEISLFFYPGGYCGLCTVEDGKANLCFLIKRSIYHRQGRSFEKILNYIRTKNPYLKERLMNAHPLWSKPMAIANLPYGYVHSENKDKFDEGIYRLGDQFGMIPSLTGTGMAIALFTGRKAVEHLDQRGKEAGVSYLEECVTTIKPLVKFSYPFHWLSRFSFFPKLALYLLKFFPPLIHYVIEKTRMPQLEVVPDYFKNP